MDASKTTILLGGPGGGKTTSLLNIVDEAMSGGVEPNRIGFVSFTKKATEEGRERASARFSIPQEELPHFRTLHSMAFKLLGMKRDQVLNWQHLRELGAALGLDFKGRGEVLDGDVYGMNVADRMLFLDGLARNTKRPLKSVWEDAFEDSIDWFELDRFSRSLREFKRNRLLYDFTDMMERFVQLDPKTLPKFDVLIVDEIQDTSPLQWDAVEMLASNAARIYVGGDDCQAIYSWSGSDVARFIELPGRQVNLEQSHRVPAKVHELAKGVSDRIRSKRSRVWSPKSEIGAVNWFNGVDEVDMSKDTWLLLARNGYMLTELEDYCLTQGFSFNSVGRDPLKSHSLVSIKTWENLRKGNEESAEHVADVLRYMSPQLVPPALMKRLKADDADRMYAMPELKLLGLGTTAIWHESLTKISPKERDYFIAARKRGESLIGKAPRIKVSTIHASKGGEADHVLLMTDMSRRTFDNAQNAYDDECRVFYVGATRCRHTLNVVLPRTNMGFEL